MSGGWALLILGFVCTHQNVQATAQCNTINFAMQGFDQCGLRWWQGNNFEDNTANLDPQLTDIVSMALQSFGISPQNASAQLELTLQTNSDDSLRRLVETVALAEPYVLYAVMDTIYGFEMTRTEMRKLGLPESLAEEDNMRRLYESYFSTSCRADILRSLITCLTRWTDDNCEEEDKASVVIEILTNIANYYCNGQTPKQELMSVLTRDFGVVYADIARSFGVIKHPQSPYVFSLSPSSIFINQTASLRFMEIYLSTCGYLMEGLSGGSQVGGDDPFATGDPTGLPTSSVNAELQMFTGNSDVGIGVALERMFTLQYQATNCALRAWNSFMPGFFAKNAKMFNHLQLLSERHGGRQLSLAEPERGDVRHTVMVYGDPHMKAYKITGTLTCPALGSQTYLSNKYFKLVGTAELACDAPACSSATYVTSVILRFPGQAVSYQTGRVGELPVTVLSSDDSAETFTEKDGVKLEVLGSSVRITDENSAAVFLFSKFRHTYQIAVRLSESVLDNSLGLLIIGCPNPTDITSTNSPGQPARSRRDAQCETACREIEGEFRDTCVFDCKITGDLEVANITKNVMVMETLAEEKDDEMFNLYPTAENGGGIGGGITFVPNVVMVAILALLASLLSCSEMFSKAF